LTGQRFGTWTVASYCDFAADGHGRWNMVCDCGETCVMFGSTLRGGKARVCPECKPKRTRKQRVYVSTMSEAKRLYIDLRKR